MHLLMMSIVAVCDVGGGGFSINLALCPDVIQPEPSVLETPTQAINGLPDSPFEQLSLI